MKKLVKLPDNNYIIVDSQIKTRMYYDFTYKVILDSAFKSQSNFNIGYISHSTKEMSCAKTLSIFDVNEAIFKYDIKIEAHNKYQKYNDKINLSLDEKIQRSGRFDIGFAEGFNACLEHLSDKRFTIDDIKEAFNKGIKYAHKPYPLDLEYEKEFLQSLEPKTEWDIELVGINNKIKII